MLANKKVKLVLVLLAVLIFSGACFSPSWLWVLPVMALYSLHAVLCTDHLYYDPSEDYSWKLPACERSEATFDKGMISVPRKWCVQHTVLLKAKVTATIAGNIFDPYLEISTSAGQRFRQYFERGCSGERFINLTPVLEMLFETDQALRITGKFCTIETRQAELLAFANPVLDNKRVMVIAPHADDAEIAAFGLYRNTDSMVITITAGEAEPETFQHYCKDSQQAALLKGRVRAWDSIAIPKWAGLKEDRVVHLGYFCKHLERMYEQPDQPFSSEFTNTSDTRVFREFNNLKLLSDEHGTASWNQLVADLTELITDFKPDVVITPHLEVDPHRDHHYSTLAVKQALSGAGRNDCLLMYYANHLKTTDMHPFGPAGSLCSLPPVTNNPVELKGVFSFTLTQQDQQDKILAVEMNHDLRRPVRLKKWLRKRLQKIVIGRYQPDYGEDEFLRKAVRSNELFFY